MWRQFLVLSRIHLAIAAVVMEMMVMVVWW